MNGVGGRQLPPEVASEEVSKSGKSRTCPVCGVKKKFPYLVDIHMRIHTGNAPYICGVKTCGRRFCWISSLKAHEKVHHKCAERNVAVDDDEPRCTPEQGSAHPCTATDVMTDALANRPMEHQPGGEGDTGACKASGPCGIKGDVASATSTEPRDMFEYPGACDIISVAPFSALSSQLVCMDRWAEEAPEPLKSVETAEEASTPFSAELEDLLLGGHWDISFPSLEPILHGVTRVA